MARMSSGSRPALPAEQQVVQAVAFLADEDHGLHRLRGVVQLPLHLEALGEHLQLQAQVVLRELPAGEAHAHEEQARVVVVVLGGFLDVAAALEQETRNGMDDPGSVRAREGQDVGFGHRGTLSQAPPREGGP
jgi:hypothetical protein